MVKKKTAAISMSFTRPPIVAVLGHVDHGKTTLLDYIRNTSIAAGEHGGITQHIGAYQIATPRITFIDTPGHEAFSNMRSRGAHVADIVILVVAADDSVMPQTKESVRVILEAKIPFIVAANKADLPTANIDKVRKDLGRIGVQVEGFGGSVPFLPVSAKTGKGIKELLEMIELMAHMAELTREHDEPVDATVIETRLDKGKGIVATIIITKGTITIGSELFEGTEKIIRVRAMFDEKGKGKAKSVPGDPVEILGFTKLPQVGAVLTAAPVQKVFVPLQQTHVPEIPDFLKPIQEKKKLNILLKADTAGSLEAILLSLGDRVKVVAAKVGAITDADILLAKSTGAIVIGFNTPFRHEVEKLAQTEHVIFRNYAIIYELLDEITDAIEDSEQMLVKERELGAGKIIAEFPFSGAKIAGTKVISGRIARGDQVKIIRKKEEIARGKVKSVRHGKEDITKADIGIECGILFDKKVDFALGDGIIAFTTA